MTKQKKNLTSPKTPTTKKATIQGTELPCFDPADSETKAQLPEYPKKTAPPGTGGGGGATQTAAFFFHVAANNSDGSEAGELVTTDWMAVGRQIADNIHEGKMSLVWGSYDPTTLKETKEALAEAKASEIYSTNTP